MAHAAHCTRASPGTKFMTGSKKFLFVQILKRIDLIVSALVQKKKTAHLGEVTKCMSVK